MFGVNAEKVPVERVVKNMEALIREKPEDAQGYYVLARVHAMAWAYGEELNLVKVGEGELRKFGPYDSVEVRALAGRRAGGADYAHLAKAIENYREAVKRAPGEAIYQLGLAWVLQEAGRAGTELPGDFLGGGQALTAEEKAGYARAVKELADADAKVREGATKKLMEGMPRAVAVLREVVTEDPEVAARVEAVMRGYWDLQALEHYRAAFEAAKEKDMAAPGGLSRADWQVSREAGEEIVKLVVTYPQAVKKGEQEAIAETMKVLDSKAIGITPIVVGLHGEKAVGELEARGKRVGFDVAGDGVKREWTWVKAGTGILVWDPSGRGEITSGRQLFGGRTWWVFYRDGYEALSVLDDDRDGELRGEELAGIRVWVDGDGDGVCSAGEVKDLGAAGIVGIGVRGVKGTDGVLIGEVRFADGRMGRTFDWVAESGRGAEKR
jgi:tetratricopeptide (TPR) repeat protein